MLHLLQHIINTSCPKTEGYSRLKSAFYFKMRINNTNNFLLKKKQMKKILKFLMIPILGIGLLTLDSCKDEKEETVLPVIYPLDCYMKRSNIDGESTYYDLDSNNNITKLKIRMYKNALPQSNNSNVLCMTILLFQCILLYDSPR